MKLNISRIPSMAEHGEESTVMLNISLQAGKQLAQVMQCLGIQSMRLSSRETMGSQGLGTDETHFFDDVPQPILKWGSNSIYPLSRFMEAFGISEIHLEAEEGDLDTLSAMWAQLQGTPATRTLSSLRRTTNAGDYKGRIPDAEMIEL